MKLNYTDILKMLLEESLKLGATNFIQILKLITNIFEVGLTKFFTVISTFKR